MSKPSRRRRQAASPPASSRPAAARPVVPVSSPAPTTPHTAGTSALRPGAQTSRPVGTPSGSRAGRRDRARVTYERSFTERYRGAIVAVAAVAAVALIAIFVFASASSTAYACTTEWDPAPTPAPAAGATPNLGYVQPDMGRRHAAVGEKVTYTYCPPASGSHDNAAGAGPIQPRVYGPNDVTIPEGWVHNLEHGAMVILYRGRDGDPGVSAAGQQELRTLFNTFPASPICGIAPGTSVGPVIARFDQMAWPYAAMVWGRVLPLQTLDTAQILQFYAQYGERTNPEPQCTVTPSAAPSAEPSAAPSAGASEAPSAAPSGPASEAPSAAPSEAPSAAPSVAPSAPSPS